MSIFARPSALLAMFTALAIATSAAATPVTLSRTEINVDYVAAGLAGIGDGAGTIALRGVNGPVHKAFLYWHGMNNTSVSAVYDNAVITFANSSITGTSLGDASTNCWGDGSSRAFFADVTHLVQGNGDYGISGLAAKAGSNGNGASLIVTFDDGNPSNNRDLVFFEGNDSDYPQGFPGDAKGWQATLGNINYGGGSVFAHIHVADGQLFGNDDDDVTFESTAGSVTIPDTDSRWDGNSLPDAGHSRASNGGLWDIHDFDISGAFGAAGSYTLDFSGMFTTGDCHGLVAMVIDLATGAAPCGNGVVDEGEECDPNESASSCPANQSCLTTCTCGCVNDSDCNDGNVCTTDSCNAASGACRNVNNDAPCGSGLFCTGSGQCQNGTCVAVERCPSGPSCPSTCNEAERACLECGRPVSSVRCIVNPLVILRGALDLAECYPCLCDVDDNGEVTATDALMVLHRCVGNPVDLTCPDPASAAAPAQ